jgi:hypothetical protein
VPCDLATLDTLKAIDDQPMMARGLRTIAG